MIRIGRYKETRYWAVWIGDDLIAVVLYRKGAERIAAELGHGKEVAT